MAAGTFREFLEHLNQLENKTYSQLFDVSKFFLPDKEVLKKLLKEKNPKFTDENVDDIVDSEEESDEKVEKEEKKLTEEEERLEKEREEQEEELQEQLEDAEKERKRQEKKEQRAQKRKEKREERKKRKKERKAAMKKLYADAVAEMKKDIQDMKKKIKKAVHKLWNDWLNLSQKLITGIVKTTTSVIAVLGIITLPPWNIPLALLTLLVILEFFLDILKQLNGIAPILQPLKFLEPFFSKDDLAKVSAVLDPPIVFILSLYTPFEKFAAFIKTILEKIKEFITNLFKQKNVFKKVTKQLKKLKYFFTEGDKSFEGGFQNTKVDETDEDDVNAILEIYKIGPTAGTDFFGYEPDKESEILGVFTSLVKGKGIGIGVIGYKSDDFEKSVAALKEPFPDVNTVRESVNNSLGVVDTYVYDVLLPDGKILNSLTEEELDELDKKFDLAFTNFEGDDDDD